MKKSETKLQNKIISLLDNLIKTYRKPIIYECRVNRGYGYKKGSPDFWMSVDGQHVEVELKMNDNERTPLQIKWETRCKKRNIEYWLIYSYEEFIEKLKTKIEIPF